MSIVNVIKVQCDFCPVFWEEEGWSSAKVSNELCARSEWRNLGTTHVCPMCRERLTLQTDYGKIAVGDTVKRIDGYRGQGIVIAIADHGVHRAQVSYLKETVWDDHRMLGAVA